MWQAGSLPHLLSALRHATAATATATAAAAVAVAVVVVAASAHRHIHCDTRDTCVCLAGRQLLFAPAQEAI